LKATNEQKQLKKTPYLKKEKKEKRMADGDEFWEHLDTGW
jgi:hypothetical protein